MLRLRIRSPCSSMTPKAACLELEFRGAMSEGILGPSRLPLKFGAFFFDYDNDGRLDLLTCNGHLEPEISAVQS